jgi:hypothetical protein
MICKKEFWLWKKVIKIPWPTLEKKCHQSKLNEMKFIIVILCALTLIETACKKQTDVESDNPKVFRKIQFSLYTDKKFSNVSDSIFFRLVIQNSNNSTLWESALAPMKIREIPDQSPKLVVEKLVPGNNQSLLKVDSCIQ